MQAFNVMLIGVGRRFQAVFTEASIGLFEFYDGPVWFSFFLISFFENLAVGRIWLWGESEYHYDYVWRKIKLFIGLRI